VARLPLPRLDRFAVYQLGTTAAVASPARQTRAS